MVLTVIDVGSPVDGPRKLSDFQIFQGVLYRRGGEGSRGWRVAIPTNLQCDVLRACHGDPNSGHEGQEKTLKRL